MNNGNIKWKELLKMNNKNIYKAKISNRLIRLWCIKELNYWLLITFIDNARFFKMGKINDRNANTVKAIIVSEFGKC